MTSADPYDLQRFVTAQTPVMNAVRAELASGRKRTHWMWFVFPQLRGLGRSGMAERYAIRSIEEARAYLDHPVLGARLRSCCGLVLNAGPSSARELFGTPDDLKFRSSMTLFSIAAPEEPVFQQCLDRFYGGAADERTVQLLSSSR